MKEIFGPELGGDAEANDDINKLEDDEMEDFMKDIFGFDPVNTDANEEEKQQEVEGPFTENDAIDEIKELTGRTPSSDEVNDWLNEMNAPFSQDYLTDGN